jgi:alpha-L-arabinofuranosidase
LFSVLYHYYLRSQHSMIASTWQPNGLEVSPRIPYSNTPAPNNNETLSLGASAQASDDGKTIVVRITNMDKDKPAKVELIVPGFSGDTSAAAASSSSKPTTWTLQSVGADGKVDPDGANSPGDPAMISPKKDSDAVGVELTVGTGASGGDSLTVPPYSYVVVVYGS